MCVHGHHPQSQTTGSVREVQQNQPVTDPLPRREHGRVQVRLQARGLHLRAVLGHAARLVQLIELRP